MTRILCVLACLVSGAFVMAAEEPVGKTVIEVSEPKRPTTDGLGTTGDVPTPKERPFQAKVTEAAVNHWAGIEVPQLDGEKPDPKQVAEEKKRKEREMAEAKAYTLAGQVGKYVGWFGIVRKATWDEAGQRTALLVQHCYSDGLSDLHIQVVSVYGGGDFQAVVDGRAKEVPLLGLVRVYGKVSAGKDGLPVVAAEYVRVWDWGLFTFMNYGIDRTNEAWRKLRRIDGDDVYTPRPTRKYYEDVLGKREGK